MDCLDMCGRCALHTSLLCLPQAQLMYAPMAMPLLCARSRRAVVACNCPVAAKLWAHV